MDLNHDIITLFKKTFVLGRPRVSNFAGIIKIATRFIKTIFKDSNKAKKH